jgi:hypothetical protein
MPASTRHVTSWERLFALAGVISILVLAIFYWRLFIADSYILFSLVLGVALSPWLTFRTWKRIRAGDHRDKYRTWVSPKVRQSVLIREFIAHWFATASCHFLILLILPAATLFSAPLEKIKVVGDISACRKRGCAMCSMDADVRFWGKWRQNLCVENLRVTSGTRTTLVVEGYFTRYAAFVVDVNLSQPEEHYRWNYESEMKPASTLHIN